MLFGWCHLTQRRTVVGWCGGLAFHDEIFVRCRHRNSKTTGAVLYCMQSFFLCRFSLLPSRSSTLCPYSLFVTVRIRLSSLRCLPSLSYDPILFASSVSLLLLLASPFLSGAFVPSFSPVFLILRVYFCGFDIAGSATCPSPSIDF